jgi:hypothetical protein
VITEGWDYRFEFDFNDGDVTGGEEDNLTFGRQPSSLRLFSPSLRFISNQLRSWLSVGSNRRKSEIRPTPGLVVTSYELIRCRCRGARPSRCLHLQPQPTGLPLYCL